MDLDLGAFGAAKIGLAMLMLVLKVQSEGLINSIFGPIGGCKHTKGNQALKESFLVLDDFIVMVENRISDLDIGVHRTDMQFKHRGVAHEEVVFALLAEFFVS